MAEKRYRSSQKAKLIFGEGKTEGAFLKYLVGLYHHELRHIKIKTDNGNGGTPDTIALTLEKKYLQLGSHEKVMLWIDSDIPIPGKLLNDLERKKVDLLLSHPRCIEGFFLDLLDDSPAGAATMTSADLKRRFNTIHLGTDDAREALRRLRRSKAAALFTRDLLNQKRNTNKTLDALLNFLGV